MFELADSGSSGDLPLLCSPLLLSLPLALSLPPSLSSSLSLSPFHLLCDSPVPCCIGSTGVRPRRYSKAHTTFPTATPFDLSLPSLPTYTRSSPLSLAICILLDSFPQEVSSSFPFLLFSSSPFPSPRVKNSLSRFPLTSPLILPLSRSGNRENGAIGAWAARALLVPLPGGASVDLPLPVHLCRSILSRPVARACGQGAPLPTIATLLFTTPYDSLAQMTRATLCNIYVCVWIGTKMRCTFMHV